MSTTADQIEQLDDRVTKLEISGARLDQQLEDLVKSTSNLKWSIWSITVILLLAVVYGALGDKGFNAVTTSQQVRQEARFSLSDPGDTSK